MQTHRKHKLFMTYYPSHKTIYSTKFMGIILILPMRNYNYVNINKSSCILQTHGKTIYFVGTCKPKSSMTKPN